MARLLALITCSVLLLGFAPVDPEPQDAPSECCRICHKGKACGDSCIARDKDCHKPRGCACDG